MGLQEGLILLGAVVFLLVLLDAMRRKRAATRRQEDDYEDPEEIERRAQLARELPSLVPDDKKASSQKGLDPLFDNIDVFDDDPIPVLRNKQQQTGTVKPAVAANKAINQPMASPVEVPTADSFDLDDQFVSEELSEAFYDEAEEDVFQTEEELAWDKMRRMFSVDPEFAEASRNSMALQQQELLDLQEMRGDSIDEEPEEIFTDPVDYSVDDLVELKHPAGQPPPKIIEPPVTKPEPLPEVQVKADSEKREKDLRTALLTSLEKSAWGSSEVFLTINVNAPKDRPFIGSHLRKFMDIIGMKLSESGFYHYTEEKDKKTYLGYSLVNMFSPGSFDLDTEEEFLTAGVVLVMPLPNTPLPMAVFERMLATARVMEKNWDAELKDEQRSNLTQQTIEHYRQTIKDFEYQTRVNAKKAKRV